MGKTGNNFQCHTMVFGWHQMVWRLAQVKHILDSENAIQNEPTQWSKPKNLKILSLERKFGHVEKNNRQQWNKKKQIILQLINHQASTNWEFNDINNEQKINFLQVPNIKRSKWIRFWCISLRQHWKMDLLKVFKMISKQTTKLLLTKKLSLKKEEEELGNGKDRSSIHLNKI